MEVPLYMMLVIVLSIFTIGWILGSWHGQDNGYREGYIDACKRSNKPKRPFQVTSHKPMQRHSTGIMEVR